MERLNNPRLNYLSHIARKKQQFKLKIDSGHLELNDHYSKLAWVTLFPQLLGCTVFLVTLSYTKLLQTFFLGIRKSRNRIMLQNKSSNYTLSMLQQTFMCIQIMTYSSSFQLKKTLKCEKTHQNK